MNKLAKYIILSAVVALIGFLLWYFSNIVAYILISAVLSLVGKPLVDILCRIKIRGWSPPKALAATITLVALWTLFVLFFRIMIPLVVSQANELSSVNVTQMVENFSEPIDRFEGIMHEYLPASAQGFSVKEFIIDKVSSFFNVAMLTNFFSSTANILISIVIAAFSVSFITFFFLKDENLFYEGVLILFPERYESNIRHALSSINKLLMRYFIGIFIQSLAIMTLNTIGLSIIGVKFQTAVVMGLLAGVLNVVPYVGPLMGTILGTLIGIASNLQLSFSSELLPLTIYMLAVFLTVQLMDNIIFQPLIFSNSVNAHPLEIFIVLLIAGSVGGILGMLLAIPGYTVIRVFGKEFFNNFRVVKKLTQKI